MIREEKLFNQVNLFFKDPDNPLEKQLNIVTFIKIIYYILTKYNFI